VAYLYFSCFLITLRREWILIDRLRLDKFLMLARKFVMAMLGYLGQHSWWVRRGVGNRTGKAPIASAEPINAIKSTVLDCGERTLQNQSHMLLNPQVQSMASSKSPRGIDEGPLPALL
jgi:hypothetical protein